MRKGVKVTSGGDLYEDTAIIEFETQHGVATYICDARQFADGPGEAIAEAQAVLDSLEPEELDEVEEAHFHERRFHATACPPESGLDVVLTEDLIVEVLTEWGWEILVHNDPTLSYMGTTSFSLAARGEEHEAVIHEYACGSNWRDQRPEAWTPAEAAGRIMNKADRACHWAGTEEWTYIVLSPDEGQVE